MQQVESDDIGNINLEYKLSNLIQGEYQFSVVAFTSKGPGEAANVPLSALPSKLIVVAINSFVVIIKDSKLWVVHHKKQSTRLYDEKYIVVCMDRRSPKAPSYVTTKVSFSVLFVEEQKLRKAVIVGA